MKYRYNTLIFMMILFINLFFHGTLKKCLEKLFRLLDLIIISPTTENTFDHQKIKLKFNRSCLIQDQITYTPQTIVNIYIVFEITKKNHISDYPTLENCLFSSVKLTKNPDIDILVMVSDLIEKENFHLAMDLVKM